MRGKSIREENTLKLCFRAAVMIQNESTSVLRCSCFEMNALLKRQPFHIDLAFPSVILKGDDKHVLFSFKAHLQYLSSVINKAKQRMKRKYGVQYVLDTIRTYYR